MWCLPSNDESRGVYKAVEQLAIWLERFGQSKRLLGWKLCWQK